MAAALDSDYKYIAATQGYVELKNFTAQNHHGLFDNRIRNPPIPTNIYTNFNDMTIPQNGVDPNTLIANNFGDYQVKLDMMPNALWEDKSNRPELQIREELNKKLMEEIDRISCCPDKYNIPRNLKSTSLVPYNEWNQISRPIREFLGYVNIHYVPERYLRNSYKVPLNNSCFKLGTNPNVPNMGLGVYLDMPQYNQKGHYLPADTKLGYYYRVYLNDIEYQHIYSQSVDSQSAYVFETDISVKIDDGEFTFVDGHNEKIKNILYIDGGKYGSLMTRVNHSCDRCSNCYVEKEYIPISLDTYLVVLAFFSRVPIKHGQQLFINYGNKYDVGIKCYGTDGLGCPYEHNSRPNNAHVLHHVGNTVAEAEHYIDENATLPNDVANYPIYHDKNTGYPILPNNVRQDRLNIDPIVFTNVDDENNNPFNTRCCNYFPWYELRNSENHGYVGEQINDFTKVEPYWNQY